MGTQVNLVGLLFVLFGLAMLVLALGKIFVSPMTDAAKGVWVLVVFLVPVFGVLLALAFVPHEDRAA